MSRRQLSRTPANFPRMKDRAAGRAIRKQRRQVLAALATYNEVAEVVTRAFSAALEAVGEMARRAGEAFTSIAEQLQRARNQDAYALAGPVDDGAP